ncbi:regulator of G-protein signaling 21-like [Menidia menidia]
MTLLTILISEFCPTRVYKKWLCAGLSEQFNGSHVSFAMPSLVQSPPIEPQPHGMDIDGKKQRGYRGGNTRCRLQCKSSQATKTERLRFEEMSQWSHSLETLLSSKLGIQIFEAFLKSEFSDENLEFWIVCEDYKKIKSSFRMTCRAKKIFKRYIQAEAPREINIDQKTKEQIRWNLKVPSVECFDDAQKTVYRLMERDSYPRFLKSDVYRTLLDSASESLRT